MAMVATIGRRYPGPMVVHEPINGLRIGGFAGGLLGAVITAIFGSSVAWLIFVFGIIGGAIGFWSERRRTLG